MIVGAVTGVRGDQQPSVSWAKAFFRDHGPRFQNDFHKIKWKPMDAMRRAAQDIEAVIQWFREYNALRKEHRIGVNDIWNFDETDFRTACPKAVYVWVPIEIKEVSIYSC
jgi:hypothetical protein